MTTNIVIDTIMLDRTVLDRVVMLDVDTLLTLDRDILRTN